MLRDLAIASQLVYWKDNFLLQDLGFQQERLPFCSDPGLMYKLSTNRCLLINSHYQIRASTKVQKKTYVIHRPFVLSNWTDNTEETLVLNFFFFKGRVPLCGSMYVCGLYTADAAAE